VYLLLVGIDVTPTSTPRTKKAFNGRRHNEWHINKEKGKKDYEDDDDAATTTPMATATTG